MAEWIPIDPIPPFTEASGSVCDGQSIHVIPVGHPEPIHIAGVDCWCNPLRESKRLYLHHAKDCREKWERQGIIDQDKKWVLVYSPEREGQNEEVSGRAQQNINNTEDK